MKIVGIVLEFFVTPFLSGISASVELLTDMLNVVIGVNKEERNEALNLKNLFDVEKENLGQFGVVVKRVVIVISFLLGILISFIFIIAYLYMIVLKGIFSYFSKKARIREKIKEIDKMSGYDFEKFLKLVFEELGYKVQKVGKVGDQGGDLIISKDGQSKIVQVKRSTSVIGNKAIQEAVAAIKFYKCDSAKVVTNNVFTKSAASLAKANDVDLIDGTSLKEILLSIEKKTSFLDTSPKQV